VNKIEQLAQQVYVRCLNN